MKHLLLILLWLCSLLVCQAQALPFQAIVAQDGSGHYTTVQEAINAAPSHRAEPWIIFIKNGSYQEQVIVPKDKSYIHLIGQDKNKTSIRLRLNVGGKPKEGEPDNTGFWNCSIHNPKADVYQYKNAVCYIQGSHFYAENLSFINDYGVESQNGPQALAMSSQADCAAFHQCIFRSYQDTWMTSTTDTDRHYVKNCYIEGAVDYFYGSGDVLVENSTFYNVREGSVIVAPCHNGSTWGYVIKNCQVDGNKKAANTKKWGGVKLGRPWHNAPKAVFIHTTLNIPISDEGWTDMGTVPALFAEYDTRDSQGQIINLNKRKTIYKVREKETGSCRATITKEEAETYTYEAIISQKDGWNPRNMMEKLPAPQKLKLKDKVVKWNNVAGAIGYILTEGELIIGITSENSYQLSLLPKVGLTIHAVNRYGTSGEPAVLKIKEKTRL